MKSKNNSKEKSKNYLTDKNIFIAINVIGVLILIYCLIPYLTHDTTIPNPDTMLAGPKWDTSGFLIVLGVIPMLTANYLLFKFIELENKNLKYLFFIPSLICILVSIHYLLNTTSEDNYIAPELVQTVKCNLNNKEYLYEIYEQEDEYSLGADEKDKIDLSKIKYDSRENMYNSIKDYYVNLGGSCE